jgi:hypothetical protein
MPGVLQSIVACASRSAVVLRLLPFMLTGIGVLQAAAAVDDSSVQEIHIQGNRSIAGEQIARVMTLKPGGALSRAAVVSDVKQIEALYRRAGKTADVRTDLTHPGEHEGHPRTVLTFSVMEGARPRPVEAPGDPLEVYFENTLVCAAARTGRDLCHLWLNRDGTFINFDAGEAKTGHYATGPMRPDGKVPVCQYWDTPDMVTPVEIAPHMGPPPGAGASVGVLCTQDHYRTTCQRGVELATLSPEQQLIATRSMGERFFHGMCYPIGPHQVGDDWFEADDPLPGELGMDRVLLVPGRQ